MRAEIEARIAELEAQLAAERAKLESLIATIPQEFHALTREMFERIKAFFG